MKLSRIVTLTAALFALLATGTALAQSDAGVEDAPDYSRSGPYIQGGLVQAWSQFKTPDVASRVGYDLAVGGRFIKYFAAEIAFEGVPGWKIRGVETNTYAVMANAKGYFPIGRVQPFVVSGLGTVISEMGKSYATRFAYRLGGGVDVFVTESLYLSLSYRYTGNMDGFGYTNLLYGVGYHFD